MAQNTGTLITAPIRPNDTLDPIASAFSNEVRGGHHTYATLAERDLIYLDRRDWGMLCTVYNDGSNNGTYKLEYGFADTSLSNNDNWILFSSGGGDSSEWLSSVLSYVDTPPTSNNGDRYLVVSPGVGPFVGEDNNIAVYDSNYLGVGGWIFYGPTYGTTLRVDDQNNVIYKWGVNGWRKDVVNQIRYIVASSSNGLSFTASSTDQEKLDVYSYSVFYTTFNMTNSGTVSLSIDNLTSIEVMKLVGTAFSSMVAGDCVPGIQYQLLYNSTFFQTQIPQSLITTIGAAEDGNYTDGLFTDFTTSTPIGTTVDRFNELFKLIVPPNAPTFSSWSATGSFVNGNLSFDGSTPGSFSTATQSTYGAVGIGGTFSNATNQYRLGITSRVSQPITGTYFYQDISGIFNINVPFNTQTPTPAWATYSFGFATTGTISLYLNGLTLSSTGLSLSTSYDLTSGGATSGLNLSAATSSKFPYGDGYEPHQNRTGTYLVKKDYSGILEGYNWISVRHDIGTSVYELSRYEWVSDGSTESVTWTNPRISVANTTTTKELSGISYWVSPISLIYTSQINNLVRNTFVNTSDALEFRDLTQQVTSSNGIVNSTNTTYPNFAPSATFSFIRISGAITPTSTQTVNMTFSVLPESRRINDNISFGMVVKRTVQGTFSGGTSLGTVILTSNWFIDTVGESSSETVENFDDENYRLVNGSDKYLSSYYDYTEIATGAWDGSKSLLDDSNHRNGLQVVNGQLIYPNVDFTNLGDSKTNPNYGSTSSNYSNCFSVNSGHGTQSGVSSNFRTYTRYFDFTSSSYTSRFILGLSWSGTSFTNPSTSLLSSATDVWVEFKLPYQTGDVPGGTSSTGGVTGWLDATRSFVPGNYDDGDGCFDGTLSDDNWNTSSGASWGITFGVRNVYWSGGYVLMRITAGPAWTGFIDRITLTPVS